MFRPSLFFVILITLFSCYKKENKQSDESVTGAHVSFEKLDSIQINNLGNPVIHDLDPNFKKILFMENNGSGRDEEIFVAYFEGNILESFTKDGDTRDTYGRLLAPLVIDGENSFMAYAFNGFMRYDFDGNLISQVEIVDFEGRGSIRIGMGSGLLKLGDKYLFRSIGRKDYDFGAKDFFDNYYSMSLLDPKSGKREPIIPLPETSIFKKGAFFYSDAWDPVFYTDKNQLYVVFGLEPVIYIFENAAPFNLISSIPIELPDYHYFKGAEGYYRDDVRFYGQRRTSGKIARIQKLDNFFILSYFPGYDVDDAEEDFSHNRSPGFFERMREKYPTRIAVFNSRGKIINDFVPEGLMAASLLERNGELWMMGKPNGDVELDYFQIFKVGLKIE